AVVDVSASMSFGSPRRKLEIAADFIEALGQSAFRVGDAFGMLAFDGRERRDLMVPATLSRGIGETMAGLLRTRGSTPGSSDGAAASGAGLREAVQHLTGRHGLVFLVSDFHWPLADVSPVLDVLVQSFIVPMVIWDSAEIEPPARNGLARLRD